MNTMWEYLSPVFVALMDLAHLVTFDIEGQPGDLH